MKDNLFDTKDKIELAVASFKTLKSNIGWQLLVDIVSANIKVLEEQILEGVEGATEEEMNRKRDKLKAYREVIDTPDYWIKRLAEPEPFEESSDPYHTAESLAKDRKH